MSIALSDIYRLPLKLRGEKRLAEGTWEGFGVNRFYGPLQFGRKSLEVVPRMPARRFIDTGDGSNLSVAQLVVFASETLMTDFSLLLISPTVRISLVIQKSL